MNEMHIEQERVATVPIAENCCEVCNKELSPLAADTSYDITFTMNGGSVLCQRHLDEYQNSLRFRNDW